MSFIGIFITLLLSSVAFSAPRRFAVLAIMASVCYVTQSQMVTIGGFHFFAFRIVLLIAFGRTLARGELRRLQLSRIDYLLIGYAVFTNVVISLRLGVWQEQAGSLYNILLSYFVFRSLVNDWDEAQLLIQDMAVFIVPLALCMVFESLTHKNVFVLMGGEDLGWMRGDRLRCVGSFRGPHTAGTFGATWMPMFVGLFFLNPRSRFAAVTGFLAATAITITSNSSGPLMAFLSGLVGLAFWRLRTRMKAVRWGIVVGLVVLAMTMKAPIWYIFAKISDITGGDGWYRSYLLEQCSNHFSDWWLMGTSDTSNWGATLMEWGGADLCNLYVSCAASAGLGCLILMVMLLVQCFRHLGRALQMARDKAPDMELLLWCFGCALFAHVVTLFSVTYFDQMQVAWWGLLAIISSITADRFLGDADKIPATTSESTEEQALV